MRVSRCRCGYRAQGGRRRRARADPRRRCSRHAGTAGRRRRCSASATRRCSTRSSAPNWTDDADAERSISRRRLARRHARGVRLHLPQRAEARGPRAELPHAAAARNDAVARHDRSSIVTRQLAALVGSDVRETDLVAEGESGRVWVLLLDTDLRSSDVSCSTASSRASVTTASAHPVALRHRRRLLPDATAPTSRPLKRATDPARPARPARDPARP